MANLTKIRSALKTMTYGVEIECCGISAHSAAVVVAGVVGGRVAYGPCVEQPDGRVWNVVHDGSVIDRTGRGACEVVTPIMKLADMESLQNVMRALRAAGAQVNESCGQHVHVGAGHLTVDQLRGLAVMTYRFEETFVNAMGLRDRVYGGRWCQPVRAELVADLHKPAVADAELRNAWYKGNEYRRTEKYNGSRYHGLNLHSLFYRGTVEFRYFGGTLHAGKMRANVMFALSMVAYAAATESYEYNVARQVKKCATATMEKVCDFLGLKEPTVRGHLGCRDGAADAAA